MKSNLSPRSTGAGNYIYSAAEWDHFVVIASREASPEIFFS